MRSKIFLAIEAKSKITNNLSLVRDSLTNETKTWSVDWEKSRCQNYL